LVKPEACDAFYPLLVVDIGVFMYLREGNSEHSGNISRKGKFYPGFFIKPPGLKVSLRHRSNKILIMFMRNPGYYENGLSTATLAIGEKFGLFD